MVFLEVVFTLFRLINFHLLYISVHNCNERVQNPSYANWRPDLGSKNRHILPTRARCKNDPSLELKVVIRNVPAQFTLPLPPSSAVIPLQGTYLQDELEDDVEQVEIDVLNVHVDGGVDGITVEEALDVDKDLEHRNVRGNTCSSNEM